MTWGECKLAALQTIYANEGARLNIDESNQEYIDAMPAKANEALQQIALVGRPLRRTFALEIAEGAAEAETEGKLTLPAAAVLYKIDMGEYCPLFRSFDEIYLEQGGGYSRTSDWSREGDGILVLNGSEEGCYTVWYNAYPKKIQTATPDDEELDAAPEAAVLVPIYIAAELYKEDDLALATVLRNEYEDGLGKLQMAYQLSKGGGSTGKVKNTTGWW